MSYRMSDYGFPVTTIGQYGGRPNRILPNNSQGPCACKDGLGRCTPCVMKGLGEIGTMAYPLWSLAVLASSGLLIYHGIKRNPKHPVGGGLLWGLLGLVLGPLGLPFMVIKPGFAKPKKGG